MKFFFRRFWALYVVTALLACAVDYVHWLAPFTVIGLAISVGTLFYACGNSNDGYGNMNFIVPCVVCKHFNWQPDKDYGLEFAKTRFSPTWTSQRRCEKCSANLTESFLQTPLFQRYMRAHKYNESFLRRMAQFKEFQTEFEKNLQAEERALSDARGAIKS